MADDVTPEQYLARLDAEADRIASQPPRTDPSGFLQPGQTLSEAMTEAEIEGMRAFRVAQRRPGARSRARRRAGRRAGRVDPAGRAELSISGDEDSSCAFADL